MCCTLDVVCIWFNGDTWKSTHPYVKKSTKSKARDEMTARGFHVSTKTKDSAQIDRHYHVMPIFTKNSSLNIDFCTASNVCIKSFRPQKGKWMRCATDAKVSFWYTLHITHQNPCSLLRREERMKNEATRGERNISQTLEWIANTRTRKMESFAINHLE